MALFVVLSVRVVTLQNSDFYILGKSNFMRYLIDKGANPVVNDLALSTEELSKLPDCASLGPFHASTSVSADAPHETQEMKKEG
jgi:hypothetical protein